MQVIWLKILSFASILMAYSLHSFLWENAFFHLTAFCFVTLTRIIWLRSVGSWKLVAMVMNLMCWNNLLDEVFFDPTVIDYNEYFTLLLTVIIVFYNKDKWSK